MKNQTTNIILDILIVAICIASGSFNLDFVKVNLGHIGTILVFSSVVITIIIMVFGWQSKLLQPGGMPTKLSILDLLYLAAFVGFIISSFLWVSYSLELKQDLLGEDATESLAVSFFMLVLFLGLIWSIGIGSIFNFRDHKLKESTERKKISAIRFLVISHILVAETFFLQMWKLSGFEWKYFCYLAFHFLCMRYFLTLTVTTKRIDMISSIAGTFLFFIFSWLMTAYK